MNKVRKTQITLGSLFSGSGGFELAGLMAGIKPVWDSDIEPFPVLVTTKRFPDVVQLGDVSRINGANIPPVDIITFGSPCQNLSIAGKREGLEGNRSSLFYEAVRVIREMWEATDGRYPEYAVWENVPGAFSSNEGEDFRSVLKALCEVKKVQVSVPEPPGRKWLTAGEIVADSFSIAWRVLDAQYWGVPQRRKRIFLVADFGGQRAGKILFKSEGLSGYSAESFRAWQGASGTSSTCFGATSRNGSAEQVTPTAIVLEHHPTDSRVKMSDVGIVQTLSRRTGTGGNNVPLVMETKIPPLPAYGIDRAAFNQGENAKYEFTIDEELQPTMVANGPGAVGTPAYCLNKATFFTHAEEEITGPLVATDYKDPPVVSRPDYIVRRLTPTECARLQGFPDWWCDGLEIENPTDAELDFWTDTFEVYRRVVTRASKPKTERQIRKWLASPYSDASAYRLWGNGVALPCVYYVLAGIAYYARESST